MTVNWTNKTNNVDEINAEDFNNAFESINEALSDKVDADGSKVLSDENFTTEEKQKLAGLSNYDDEAISEKIEEISSALSGKVDAEIFEENIAGVNESIEAATTLHKVKTVTKHYVETKLKETYDTSGELRYCFYMDYVDNYANCPNMYTQAEIDEGMVVDKNFGLYIDYEVYDTDWNLVYSGYGCNGVELGGWDSLTEIPDGLDLETTYYVVRADEQIQANTELPTHEFDVGVMKVEEEITETLKWKLLGETEITQEMVDEAGDEGILGVTVDLGAPIEQWYGETWIRAEFGATADLNSADGSVFCKFGTTVENSLSPTSHDCSIIASQSSNYAALRNQYRNKVNLFTNWHDSVPMGTVFQNTAFNAANYPTNTYATSNGSDYSVAGKQYFSFTTYQRNFKFPARTKLKLYGRF